MFYKIISKSRFEKLMEKLYQQEVWIRLILPLTSVSTICLYYPEFYFDILTTKEYHFSTEDIDSVHMPLNLKISNIKTIQRDILSPTIDGEQIILTMQDGLQIFVEHNV